MPVFPFRDRTISLTLEDDLATNGDKVVNLSPQNSFVRKFLPTPSLGGRRIRQAPKTIYLKGPTSISIRNIAGVAEEQGISTSFLQPWFIGNTQISIKGQSFIGIYPALSNPDGDAEEILRHFRKSLNDFTGSLTGGQAGNKSRFLLDLQGTPQGMRRFLGYIKEFNTGEEIRTAYMIDYTIEFIGRNVENAYLERGKKSADEAYKMSTGRTN